MAHALLAPVESRLGYGFGLPSARLEPRRLFPKQAGGRRGEPSGATGPGGLEIAGLQSPSRSAVSGTNLQWAGGDWASFRAFW
ncbi:MAG: hypothetical protein Kow0092_23810 [Deferrisomatales bacterium]